MNLCIAHFLWASLAVAACLAPIDARAADENAKIKADIIESLSTKALWHSQEATVYHSQRATISCWEPDSEGRPMSGDWISLGVVMGGLADLDETPVAIRIWTKTFDDRFLKDQSVEESKIGEDAVALFGSADGRILLRFVVKASGEVYVDDEKIGTVGYEPAEYERPKSAGR